MNTFILISIDIVMGTFILILWYWYQLLLWYWRKLYRLVTEAGVQTVYTNELNTWQLTVQKYFFVEKFQLLVSLQCKINTWQSFLSVKTFIANISNLESVRSYDEDDPYLQNGKNFAAHHFWWWWWWWWWWWGELRYIRERSTDCKLSAKIATRWRWENYWRKHRNICVTL